MNHQRSGSGRWAERLQQKTSLSGLGRAALASVAAFRSWQCLHLGKGAIEYRSHLTPAGTVAEQPK